MGAAATFQTIPEDSELLARARVDGEVAHWMQFFHSFARGSTPEEPPTPVQAEVANAVQALVRTHPGLAQRYFYAGSRTWEAIVYLLSPDYRSGHGDNDQSLIHQAIFGSERLHPDATTVQGEPIGFVPVAKVRGIAAYLDTVNYDRLHEHYSPHGMANFGIYGMEETDDDARFDVIWYEFVGMRDVYREAAELGEAVIVVID
jgi:hypothetical protein